MPLSQTILRPSPPWRQGPAAGVCGAPPGSGIAHGLAGSGAIAALLVAAVPDTMSRLVYFGAFSAGTIVGMIGVSLTLSVLVRFAAERGARWATILHLGAALASVLAGIALGWGVLSS